MYSLRVENCHPGCVCVWGGGTLTSHSDGDGERERERKREGDTERDRERRECEQEKGNKGSVKKVSQDYAPSLIFPLVLRKPGESAELLVFVSALPRTVSGWDSVCEP